MEYEGEFAHNMVRKIRWANYPFVPGIAENINSEWSSARLDSWVVTCTQCHSERFARSYLELMDKGCLLYTSDAADERSSVDLGGRRIIKKKQPTTNEGRYINDQEDERSKDATRGTTDKKK